MKIISKICYVLYYCFAYYLPKSNSKISFGAQKIRALLAAGFIDFAGKNINIQCHATISNRIIIGDYSGIGIGSVVQGGVSIGKHVMMGPEVYIYTQNHKHDKVDITMDRQGFENERSVVIEDDVWIGSRVTILPGVKIGKGSIIGTASVVTKDVLPYTVVAGNPAKFVKARK